MTVFLEFSYLFGLIAFAGQILLINMTTLFFSQLNSILSSFQEPVVANNATASTVAFIAPGPPNPPITQVRVKIHPVLQIVLMQFIFFFKSSQCNSTYSSNRPGAVHPIIQIFLVQNSQHGKELNQFCPPSSSDDLCIFFYLYPFSMVQIQ